MHTTHRRRIVCGSLPVGTWIGRLLSHELVGSDLLPHARHFAEVLTERARSAWARFLAGQGVVRAGRG